MISGEFSVNFIFIRKNKVLKIWKTLKFLIVQKSHDEHVSQQITKNLLKTKVAPERKHGV